MKARSRAPSWGFEAHAVAQAAYSVFFFLLAFTIALNPEKLTQRLGKILSPTLLTLIAVLFIAAIVHPLGEYGAVRAPYDAAPSSAASSRAIRRWTRSRPSTSASSSR